MVGHILLAYQRNLPRQQGAPQTLNHPLQLNENEAPQGRDSSVTHFRCCRIQECAVYISISISLSMCIFLCIYIPVFMFLSMCIYFFGFLCLHTSPDARWFSSVPQVTASRASSGHRRNLSVPGGVCKGLPYTQISELLSLHLEEIGGYLRPIGLSTPWFLKDVRPSKLQGLH